MTVGNTVRVGGSILFGIALVAVAFFLKPEAPGAPLEAAVVVPVSPRTPQKPVDQDSDGFPDWEEELYGSDPKIPTTEESLFSQESQGTSTPYEPKTITDQFGQDFFEYYLMHNMGDSSMTEEERAVFLKQAAQSALTALPDKQFTNDDIFVGTDDSIDALRAYGNTVALILSRPTVQNENELLILDRALKADDPKILSALDPIITSYEKMIEEIQMLHVPPKSASEHVSLLNSLSRVHNTVSAMKNAFEDPLPALMRTQQYQKDAESLARSMQSMHLFLAAHGVIFKEEDPGVFFASF